MERWGREGEKWAGFEGEVVAAWELGVRKFVTEFWYTGNAKWRDDLQNVRLMFAEMLQMQK